VKTDATAKGLPARGVIACRIMEPELEHVRQGRNRIDIRYLDQGLHRTPQKMAQLIQEQIDEMAERVDLVILGYGLCSNGIVGVTARKQDLLVPRCHDCIGFFLGSPSAYEQAFRERPGTYYLTPGWIAEKKDPLGIVEEDYTPKFGRDTALWVMREELKHYTHIALVYTGVGELGPMRERAQENARVFEMTYIEIPGSLEFFGKLLWGPYTEEAFFRLHPGESVTQGVFLEAPCAAG
jgi:hypothetical protein